MHLPMCSGCRNYSRQTKLINILLDEKMAEAPPKEETRKLEETIISNLT
jgi:predicted anti-sigma-YlaC factor YlaD